MRRPWQFGALTAVLLLTVSAFGAGTSSATIQFKLDFPGANPSHYEISVDSAGRGSYTSDGVLSAGALSNPAPLEFTVSETTLQEIFKLARRSHYFNSKVDSENKKIANTGTKTLTYKDASHDRSATYNYSPNPSIQQITAIFQGLSTVLEYGRRLTYFHKYEKLALDDDLKQMEERQRENALGDVEAIAPILQSIANDASVMNISRARALRLLAVAGR
jgi:hypothetical protein